MTLEDLLEIKQLAREFVEANFDNPTATDYLVIENAMIRGAVFAMEKELKVLRARVERA